MCVHIAHPGHDVNDIDLESLPGALVSAILGIMFYK